jgi:hypothetical protein
MTKIFEQIVPCFNFQCKKTCQKYSSEGLQYFYLLMNDSNDSNEYCCRLISLPSSLCFHSQECPSFPAFWTKKMEETFFCASLDIYGIPYMKRTRNSAEFRGIFSQFRTEYGIDGSKKNRRNSVSTEFRGHPSCGVSANGTAVHTEPINFRNLTTFLIYDS